MNITDFLRNPLFLFPQKSSKYFPDNLNDIFDQYLILLKSVDDEHGEIISSNIASIENTCVRITAISEAFFEGKLSKAYDEFAILISHLEKYLIPNKYYASLEEGIYLFKARRFLDKSFTVKDMFHIPFEKRYTVKTNRFSISGLPCLYLSNSIYTCWEELDRPAFSQMAVSRFDTDGQQFKYLDLSINLSFLQVGFEIERLASNPFPFITENSPRLLSEFINLYPLYVACYTQVYSKDADFKPEYFFPQMLMQWVANSEDIDGVIYESTKANNPINTVHKDNVKEFAQRLSTPGHLNYAIPVKSNRESGICDVISRNFRLTNPTSWEIENIINPDIIIDSEEIKARFYDRIPSPPIKNITLGNKSTDYYKTAFGKLEDLLFSMPLIDLR
jgi:hypothetical protein